MRRRFLFIAALTLVCLFGATVSPCAADTFAYVPKSDGTIARFCVNARTGKLNLLLSATDTGFKRPVSIVLSADKRFLYAYRTSDVKKDGVLFDFLGDKPQLRAASTKPNPIKVFRIEASGDLRAVETVVVPGPIGELVVNPKGRFAYALTVSGAFLLDCARGDKGRALIYNRRVALFSAMSILDTPSDRNAWGLTFAPSGKYLYAFNGTGFGDHAENYLQRYALDTATGQPKASGGEWQNNYGDEPGAATEAGRVDGFIGRTAFIAGFAPGCAVAIADKNGRISEKDSRFLLHPKDGDAFHYDQTLVRHPTLPLFVYRGNLAESFSLWRVTGPGKIAKIGRFDSAFGLQTQRTNSGNRIVKQNVVFEPSGRFLYELTIASASVLAPRVAVYALSSAEAQAKVSAPPAALPLGCDTMMVFASAPKISATTRPQTPSSVKK